MEKHTDTAKRERCEDNADNAQETKLRKTEEAPRQSNGEEQGIGKEFWSPLVGWWNHVPPYANPYGSKLNSLMVKGRIEEVHDEGKRYGLVFPVFGQDVVEKTQAYLDRHAIFGDLPTNFQELTSEMVSQYEKGTADVPELSTKSLAEKDEIYLKHLGIQDLVGSKLEVLWDTQDEETGKSNRTWFACTLEGLVETPTDPNAQKETLNDSSTQEASKEEEGIWLLRYAAKGDFPETLHRCKFIDRAILRDLEFQSDLTWRLEGQSVDRSAMQASLSKMVVSMVQVLQHQTEIEEEEGEKLEEHAAEELQKFPFYVQQVMAGIYRNFADTLKGSLRRRMETLISEGKEPVITVKDVTEIMAEVKASKPIQIPTYL
mmetsp:Transcript_18865/g.24312  ORF Transcript_18865/g.24312 Transcript_18865/m.24312 type:complete len:374 (+) Transcript_18865:143-1264(+)